MYNFFFFKFHQQLFEANIRVTSYFNKSFQYYVAHYGDVMHLENATIPVSHISSESLSKAMIYWLFVHSFSFSFHILLSDTKYGFEGDRKIVEKESQAHEYWRAIAVVIVRQPSVHRSQNESSVHATIWNDILYLFWIVSLLTTVYT